MGKNVSKPVQVAVWGMLGIVIASIAVLFAISQSKRAAKQDFPVISQIKPFKLTNQLGAGVTLDQLHGKVWLANIIFTRCAGPCPAIARLTSEIQKELKDAEPIQLVTLTTDPENDTPPVLKKYAERFANDPVRWWFLTGPKSEIASLAMDSLKLTALDKSPEDRESPADLFIHSTIFVFVDRAGNLRGSVESTDPDSKSKILAGLRQLVNEK